MEAQSIPAARNAGDDINSLVRFYCGRTRERAALTAAAARQEPARVEKPAAGDKSETANALRSNLGLLFRDILDFRVPVPHSFALPASRTQIAFATREILGALTERIASEFAITKSKRGRRGYCRTQCFITADY